MTQGSGVSDAALARALGVYVGMVQPVLADPQRWLGADEDPRSGANLPSRALHAVRDRVVGETTPASPEWAEQPLEARVRWWVNWIGTSAGLAAAAPRFAGALADRIPLQSALGAAASGLVVCAVAREHGVTAAVDWVPLLARVLFDRGLEAQLAAVPPAHESERELQAAVQDRGEPPSRLASLSEGAQRAVRTLWRLARALLGIDDLLDERPRGGLLARAVAKLPVVGVAGGWLDERGAIRRAATETTRLLS